jgi:hypothetical protein
MELKQLLRQMQQQADSIRALAEGISDDQARWKPDPESWSIIEVLNHLYDEEQYDFFAHLKHILYCAGDEWSPIDPMGWVEERQYNQHSLAESLHNFLQERQKCLCLLAEWGGIDWQAACTAPWGGEITAGDMMAAWVAHDLLHLRQLVELHYAYLAQLAQPYGLQYAGDW